MTHLSTLNKYFWRYRWHFFLGICFVILTNYFRILSPQLTGYVINTVVKTIGEGNTAVKQVPVADYDILVRTIILQFEDYSFRKQVLVAGVVLLSLAIISGLFMFLMRQTIIVMSRHIEFDQKNEVFDHYQKLDRNFYKKHSTGDLMNRISEDVSRVRMYTGPAVMYFINLAAVIGFSLYFMIRSDFRLTVLSLSPLPILAIAIYFVNSIINKKSERIQRLLSNLTTNAQESYSGIRVIKSYVQERAMAAYFSDNSESYRRNALGLAKTEAIYFPSMALLVGLSTLIAVMAGGLDVVNGVKGASVGKIAEFVMYIQMLTFPVSAIGWTASMTQRAAASQERINEFLHTQPEIADEPGALAVPVKGDIQFNDVSFDYPQTGIMALKNLNFHIKAGERVAIIGATGSGKSTLAALLLRMMDPTSGSIVLDGVPLKNHRLKELREGISYVPQEVFLFSDSVSNNILFGNRDANEADVIQAATIASVHKEISRFKDGYATMVGERGLTLSGGQKQRISIARALVKDPQMIILDDCLSAVDSETEKEILNSLNEFLEGKTAIIITHRIFSLMQFDRIFVLHEGGLAEEGTHEGLIKLNGRYAGLYRKQQQEWAGENPS